MLNKPVTKGHIIYDSIYLKCLEKVNSSEGRETGEGGKEHVCTYGWFLLTYDRKPQNSEKQLSFD